MKIRIHDSDEAQMAMQREMIGAKHSRLLRGKTLDAINRKPFVRTRSDNPDLDGWNIPADAFTVIEEKEQA